MTEANGKSKFRRTAPHITKEMYGWTKYGGGKHGLVREQLKTWYCQICGEEQTQDLSSYMVNLGDRNFLRICSKCWHKIKQGYTLTEVRLKIKRKMWCDTLG